MRSGSTDYTSLEGLLLRLQVFSMGETARIYAPGQDTVAVEDLGLLGPAHDRWGISILEGGAAMSEYPKAVILGLVAWHLYNDALVRRQERINAGGDARITQLVFEEANKVLTGVDLGLSDGPSSGATTSARFQTMWRDGRRYGIFLHPIVQSPAELPPGILSSCNNLVIGQLKNPADRDTVQAALGWSEKGFTDEDYKRFISRMPATFAIIKLGYTADHTRTAPMLARPILVQAPEPTDTEIYQLHQHRRHP
jgi:hypothetical protein